MALSLGDYMKYIWDKMYLEPTNGKTFHDVLASVSSALPNDKTILRAFELNHVPQGQNISFSGARFGIRVVFKSDMEPMPLLKFLEGQTVTGCSSFQQLFSVVDQNFPPRHGDFKPGSRVELMFATIQFSNGRGATTANQEKATRGNQAKDTKNKLNVESDKVGKPIRDLQKYIDKTHGGVQVFSNAFFYLERFLEGGTGASGGAYQFHASAEAIVNELAKQSNGIWWNESESSVFIFEASAFLNSYEDPRSWYQYSPAFMNAIRKPFDEDKETGGTLAWEKRRGVADYDIEDLEYYAERLSHASRSPSMSMGSEHGFAPGLEEIYVKDQILSPWVFSEIVALVQAYMLSQMPRYWAGTQPDVKLLQEIREE
jgi:hypothetical protein